MKRKGILAGIVVSGVVLITAQSAVFADAGTEAVQKYRQRVMMAISGHMGGTGEILKGELPYQGHIAEHARAVSELAKLIPSIFPKDSGSGKTDALPKIWSDGKDFEAKAKALQDAAAELAMVAQGGDMGKIAAQAKKVGGACGDCHKKFRQPKAKSFKSK